MAKVTNITKPEPTFTLELTGSEAQVLYNVTGAIGGEPAGDRGKISNIRNALTDAGMKSTNTYSGSITCPNTPS